MTPHTNNLNINRTTVREDMMGTNAFIVSTGSTTTYLHDFNVKKQDWEWVTDITRAWPFEDVNDALDYITEWGTVNRTTVKLGGVRVVIELHDAGPVKMPATLRSVKATDEPAVKAPVKRPKVMKRSNTQPEQPTNSLSTTPVVVGYTMVDGAKCDVVALDGLTYPLTPCCGASGKGSGYSATGVVCRACHQDVSPVFGDVFGPGDYVSTVTGDDAQTADDFAKFDGEVCVVEVDDEDGLDVLVGYVSVDGDKVLVECGEHDQYVFEAVDVEHITLAA